MNRSDRAAVAVLLLLTTATQDAELQCIIREYKKVRVQFYTDDYANWERDNLGEVKIALDGIPRSEVAAIASMKRLWGRAISQPRSFGGRRFGSTRQAGQARQR
jgi:hypothetical protein